MEAQLPQPLQLSAASVARSPFALLPSGHDNSLGTVLKQVSLLECTKRMNRPCHAMPLWREHCALQAQAEGGRGGGVVWARSGAHGQGCGGA